ncbi:MAG TPA: 50S ribosomal protein L4 [Candidatus Omnitrophota bacterium]|nr:50S ribosomal protein L4 [Candidatus Omnitrophota bacterium]HQJ15863.1 50S ribosomal protein L4 [Candidatus Omnitrophota bacterium]
MFTLPVFNCDGKEIESIKLDEKVFSDKILTSPIYQAIRQYRAGQRSGLAATKTRGEVSGGGKKPWKQKGTGRARVGSIRSPLWRHGGVVFGPHPRDFSFSIPRNIKTVALRNAVSAKAAESRLVVVDGFQVPNPKTKDVVKILQNLKAFRPGKKVLVVVSEIDKNLRLACANLRIVKLDLPARINTYDVLVADRVIATKAALKELTKRIG